jgi:hypothetical protein
MKKIIRKKTPTEPPVAKKEWDAVLAYVTFYQSLPQELREAATHHAKVQELWQKNTS